MPPASGRPNANAVSSGPNRRCRATSLLSTVERCVGVMGFPRYESANGSHRPVEAADCSDSPTHVETKHPAYASQCAVLVNQRTFQAHGWQSVGTNHIMPAGGQTWRTTHDPGCLSYSA